MAEASMVAPLHAYQEEFRDFLIDRLYVQGKAGAGLFLDPGLGKSRITLEALKFLMDVGEVRRVLVVAPLRVVKLVWPDEVTKWMVPLRVADVTGPRGFKRMGDLELLNYESLHKALPYAGRWDAIVLDESTKIKSWGAKRTKALRKLLPSFKKRIILTGTPAANSLADLFAQIFMLDDGESLGRNVTVFRAMYMERGGYLGRQWVFRRDMEETLLTRVASLVVRGDANAYLDMPMLLTHAIWCDMPAEAMREYKRLKAELLAELETGDILAMNAGSAFAKMRQLANGAVYDSERNVHRAHDAKLDALVDLVEELGGKPVMVFYQFQHDAARILQRYPKAAILSGSTPEAEATRIVAQWNAGEIALLAIQPQSASHGLNLQYGPCADVVWYGLHASPEVVDQANRRVYRQGQKNRQIRIHRLLCRDTLEFEMGERLDGKYKTQAEFLGALKRHAQTKS